MPTGSLDQIDCIKSCFQPRSVSIHHLTPKLKAEVLELVKRSIWPVPVLSGERREGASHFEQQVFDFAGK